MKIQPQTAVAGGADAGDEIALARAIGADGAEISRIRIRAGNTPQAAVGPGLGPDALRTGLETVREQGHGRVGRGDVAVIETAVGRAVAVHAEVGDVVRLKIVSPVKIKAHRIAGEAERRARNGEHQLIAADGVGDVAAHGRPIPAVGRGRVLKQRRRRRAHAAEIHRVIVAFPAGRVIFIGVNEQHHPVRTGGAGEVRVALREEIKIVRVARNFQHGEIVPAGGVRISAGRRNGRRVVAESRVVGRIVITWRNRIPLGKTAGQIDRLRRARGRRGADAFAPTVLADHLEIIIVRVPALHRFEVAAVFLVVFVHEIKATERAAIREQARVTIRRRGIRTGDPFVPLREK